MEQPHLGVLFQRQPVQGDTYYNTTDGNLYVYNGTSWETVGEGGTTPSGGTLPSTASTGDTYYNTTDGNLYVYNGTSWETVGGGGTTPSGGTLPSTANTGDTFYNTTDGNLYVYNGTSWETVGGGGTTPSGGTLPSTANTGDTFYNTTDGNLYVYNGTSWETAGTDDQTAAEVAVTPNSTIGLSSSNVQNALEELQGEITTAVSGGMTSVVHDTSLSGNGVIGNELGIADNGVSLAKIADGGASQVLTTDASGNPQWQNITTIQGSTSDELVKVGSTGTAKVLSETDFDGTTTGITIKDGAITTAKIADGTIMANDIKGTPTSDPSNGTNTGTYVLTSTYDGGFSWTDISSGVPTDAANIALSTGNILVGGNDGKASSLDVKTSGQILIGNGTTLASKAVSGDVTINNDGVTTIGTLKVQTGMLAADAVTNAKLADDAIQTENIKDGEVKTADIADENVTVGKLDIVNAETDGQVLSWSATDTKLKWTSALTDDLASSKILVGNSTDKAAAVSLSGDATIDNTGVLTIEDLAVEESMIATDAVVTAKIKDLNVTTGKLAADAVDNTKLADNAVQTENITDGEVKTADLGADAVDNTKLADNAVQTENIKDENVTVGKLDIVNTETDGQVLSWSAADSKLKWSPALTKTLAQGSVFLGNASNEATTLDAKAEGQILIGNGTTLASKAVSGDVTINNDGVTTIGTLKVQTGMLAADAVTNAKLADDAIQTENIKDGEVKTADIADENVTVGKLDIVNAETDGQVLSWSATDTKLKWTSALTDDLASSKILVGNSTDKAAAVSLSGDATIDNTGALTIEPLAVEESMIATDAVVTAKIKDLNVTTGKLALDAVTNAQLADDAVQTENIKDGEVKTADIADDNVTVGKLDIVNAETDGQVLSWSAADTKLKWTSALTDDLASSKILVGNGTDKAAAVSLSGDATIDNTGALTIEPLAVEEGMIATDAVVTAKIKDLNVTTGKLAADAVDNTKLADNAVQTENITDGEVKTADLDADAVDNTKLADNAVQTENIKDGEVKTADIADDNVTVGKLDIVNAETDGQVLSWSAADSKLKWSPALTKTLAQGSVFLGNASNEATTLDAKADGQILIGNGTTLTSQAVSGDVTIDNAGVTTIGTTKVQTGMLAADAVTNAKLADDAVQTENIKDGEVKTDDLAADAVTTVKILDLNVTTGKLALDAVTNAQLADNAVQTENIADGEVKTADLGADAVDNTKLADNAVQTENIKDGEVKTADIADDNVTVGKLDIVNAETDGQVLSWSAADTKLST